MTIRVNVKALENFSGLEMPKYETSQSAGVDLLAAIEQEITLKPNERILVPTGLALALPKGFEAQVRPRSGLALRHGVTVLNTPGTIDADYRGEIKVILINLGEEDFHIHRGMRVAQMIFAEFQKATWQIVSSLDETERGEGGFGSTGTA